MPLPTRRRSRKPARDPVVEQLLQAKDTWKDEVSHLIWDLIAFKRGLNGKGDTEHELPPTKITQPFGGSYTKLLAEMASEYQTLAQQALEIIQRQNEISQEHTGRREQKNKQRLMPRPGPGSEPKTEPTKIENPLAPKFQGQEAELGKAAGPLSRTMYRLKTPFSNEVGRKTRVDMLLKLVAIKHELEEMQDASVSLGNEDAERLTQAFTLYGTKLFELHRLYQQYASELGKQDFVRNRNIMFDQTSRYVSDYQRYFNEFRSADAIGYSNYKKQFHALVEMFKRSTNDIERKDIIQKMERLYRQLITALGREYRTIGNVPWRTVSELANQPYEKIKYVKDDEGNLVPTQESTPISPLDEPESTLEPDTGNSLVTEAHNVLTRMLKRKRMNLPFGDWSASTRSKLFDELAATRQSVKKFMKAIEDGHSFEDLYQYLDGMKTGFDQIQRDVLFLTGGKKPKEKL